MALAAGTKLGPYEIQGPLGAGGMGEVYRARDTRLGRTVAIKILPSHLSSDRTLQQRFEREARAISSLQHAHICVLHDIGHHSGTDFLVLEYLEGETLADRLLRGPLPLHEALTTATEIAEALAKAHERGVLHRDLKPGNIMLTRSGAKLMDFGLAKAASAGVGSNGQSSLTEPTQTCASLPVTAKGSFVGTFQYMAPEVLDGEEADARSDIFSFGCVLYEMISSRRAFDGKTAASVVAAVLEREPEAIATLQPMTPPALDRLVRACLAKQRDQRWHSAHDLCVELQWLAQAPSAVSSAPARARTFVPWILAAALALLLAMILALQWRRPTPAPQMLHSWLTPPPGLSFVPFNFAISPDGKRLAFATTRADGKSMLWVRSMNTTAAQEISGSEDAQSPFWAPDSRRLGFFSHGQLKTVDLGTGEVRTLVTASVLVGGTWNRDDIIVFAAGPYSTLQQVSANGGSTRPVTSAPHQGSGQAHRWPFFLPDGVHFLYFADWSAPGDPQGNGLYVGSLQGGAPQRISPDIVGSAEYANGQLLYFRDRSIVAQPFDVQGLTLTGSPTVVTEQGVERHVAFSKAGFSSSATGTLVFQSAADSPTHMTWFDDSGRQLDQLPETGGRDPRLSPDGHLLAVTSDEAGNGRTNIRVYDPARSLSTTITSGAEDEFPLWSPDGRTIYYSSHQGQTFSINRVPADAARAPEVWLQGSKMIPNSFTPDGRYLSLMNLSLGGTANIDIISTADRKLVQRFVGAESQFSPDGHWIGYTFRGGELFVQAFPGPGARIQVSNGGGAQPRWSSDGSRLYYIAPDKRLMMVRFDPTGKRSPTAPVPVMQTRISASHFAFIQYDIAPDGRRFVINSLPPSGGGPLSLITNWPAELHH